MTCTLGKGVLLLGRITQGTSDYTSAYRFRRYFETSMQTTWIPQDLATLQEKHEVTRLIADKNIDCVIGNCVVLSSKLLRDCIVPYALVFSAYDVEEIKHSPENVEVVTLSMLNARHLIVTTKSMETKILEVWPNLDKDKLLYIPQGVLTFPAADSTMEWLEKYQIKPDSLVFVIITRIEPNRDPLHIVPVFTHWHQTFEKRPFLIIVGPITDIKYGKRFLATIDGCPGVIHVGLRTIHETHRLIAMSYALVNSSPSSGTNLHLLESMDLGVPVLARASETNMEFIKDEQNGLIYTTPEDFITKAEMLVKHPDLRTRLVEQARVYLTEEHSTNYEKKMLNDLADNLTKTCILGKDDDEKKRGPERHVRFRFDEDEPAEIVALKEEPEKTEVNEATTVVPVPVTIVVEDLDATQQKTTVSMKKEAPIKINNSNNEFKSPEFVDSWMAIEAAEESETTTPGTVGTRSRRASLSELKSEDGGDVKETERTASMKDGDEHIGNSTKKSKPTSKHHKPNAEGQNENKSKQVRQRNGTSQNKPAALKKSPLQSTSQSLVTAPDSTDVSNNFIPTIVPPKASRLKKKTSRSKGKTIK